MKLLSLISILISQCCYSKNFEADLVEAAIERTRHNITYDGSYYSIDYPNGDVPSNIGVCTDVIIRSYRAIGTDLQKLVHEDMRRNFDDYPSKRIWGLSSTDKNIDHRRVPNLQSFFNKVANILPISDSRDDYRAGDIVTWSLAGSQPHIGIVVNKKSVNGTPLIVHNIGAGPRLDDVLFSYKITGHYRYVPSSYSRN